MSEESQRIKKPSSGYATDHFYDGAWHRAVKSVEGSVEFFDVYDVIFEGITYQSPPILVSENLIIVPIAKDEVAWNSKIEIYGAIGTGESEKIFSDGDAVRPFAGELDVSNPQEPLVIFGGGNVSRFPNYTASVNGVEYGDLTGFATSYELRYEGTSIRNYRGLSPTHIRYENIGHHVELRSNYGLTGKINLMVFCYSKAGITDLL
ncbi:MULTISPECIES: hypothetical protein [Photorhabdus]|uniref:hypothetical protein n=1 Tax=Photorhabdus TaxID=29487 RepID=UPI001E4582DC|nr:MULTISPECIES: hypothetical protein [Photorhabdus]MCT8352520.1 hypothetical protein [Photorhabdus kayaii]